MITADQEGAPFQALPRIFADGELVDGVYEVRSMLGSGGMGEVYEAHDRGLNRRVALKVARPDISGDYLLREGRALAAIRHPGVVGVQTMGRFRGTSFLVLELVQGLSVDRLLQDRRGRGERYDVNEALDLVIHVADALAVVHKAGLAHRDVKPANLMLAPGGRVVLMDFGLVLPHADRAGYKNVAGSVDYMSPEAMTAEVAEGAVHLVDVYALGILAYELLTGIVPFDGADTTSSHRAKLRPPSPIDSLRGDVPAALRDIIYQMISVDPGERPQSAEAALWQLRAIRKRSGTSGAPRPFVVLVVDDDEDMRGALSLYVRAAAPDADVETAVDGGSALRAVRRRVPDLMLLDLALPDMNGIEVCMHLRGMRLGDSCVVVSVSGRAKRADVQLLQELGVRSLEKGPALMEELTRLVQKMRPSR